MADLQAQTALLREVLANQPPETPVTTGAVVRMIDDLPPVAEAAQGGAQPSAVELAEWNQAQARFQVELKSYHDWR